MSKVVFSVNSLSFAFLLALSLSISGFAEARILYVSASRGSNMTPSGHVNFGTNISLPCATISHAVNVSVSGDTICVDRSTYTERILIEPSSTFQLNLQGGWDEAFSNQDLRRKTPVLVTGGSALSIQARLGSLNINVSGFKFSVADRSRSVVYIEESRDATSTIELHNNRIEGGQSQDGGGVWVRSWGTLTLEMDGNIVTDNRADHGGGINVKCYGAHATLRLFNNIITKNTAEHNGGGIAFWAWAPGFQANIVNNTISSNVCTNYEGGIGGGGLFIETMYSLSTGTVYLTNSIVWGNKSMTTGRTGGMRKAP